MTTYGAARMVLETGEHPALLKDAVTTPAGCTADGLLELEEGGLRVTLIKAVVKSTQRAGELLFEHSLFSAHPRFLRMSVWRGVWVAASPRGHFGT